MNAAARVRALSSHEISPGGSAIGQAYDGTSVVFRVLRCAHWGPELMNLGYTPSFLGLGRVVAALRSCSTAQRTLAHRAIRLMNIAPGDRVLDIACGRGGSSHMIRHATPAAEVQAIDLLEENVQLAHRLFPRDARLVYQQGDAQNLPFGESRFDRALCCEAAFHFPDRARFLTEAGRVLAGGGRLVVVDFVWREENCRADADHPETRCVRDVWQWRDLSTLDEYAQAGRAAGLNLARTELWTRQVTMALQRRMEFAVWMVNRPWGRRVMLARFPLLRSLSDADWSEFAKVTRAHRYVTDRTHYTAMVFEKASPPRPKLGVVG